MNNAFKQLIKSFFLGGIATIVDFLIFSLCNFIIFKSLSNIPFKFGPFNYSVADGGTCTFVSTALSYLLSQVVNYFVQKKYAFDSETKKMSSFILYLTSSFITYLIILYIPGIIGEPINNILGFVIGPLVTKGISNFIGFLIQFPINKFIIFNNKQ